MGLPQAGTKAKRRFSAGAAGSLTATIFALLFSSPAAAVPSAPDHVPGRVLVRARDSISETQFQARLRQHGFAKSRRSSRTRVRSISIPDDRMAEILARLRADPAFQYAEPDWIATTTYVPNDELLASGQIWHLDTIQAPRAWEVTTGVSSTVVAVLDTGVASDHPDLAGRVVAGYDFVNNDPNPSDDFGHGTAVAGVIAASGNNGIGVAGVAFGASVLPVKVADFSGFAAYSAIAEGIHYSVEKGARIINISIAGTMASSTLQEAVDFARSRGAVVVASAGNDGNSTPLYPASCAGVLSVGATTQDDLLASFSSFGPSLRLTAPGDGIWTTQNDALRPYGAWRGTSFSTPIVSGVAALALSLAPDLRGHELEQLLLLSTQDLGPAGWDPTFGFGRIDAARMIELLTGVSLPPDEHTSTPPPADTVRPSVYILQGPPPGTRLKDENATWSGTARDNMQVSKVMVRRNDAETLIAEGTTNWSITVPLAPGTNVLAFCSSDADGNTSSEARVIVFRVLKSPIQVECEGDGRLVPALDGKDLEIGRAYTVRAVPGVGSILAGWGDELADSPILRFVMQPGLVLKPRFIENPFPAVKGNYAGLITNPEGVTPSSSGYFGLTLGNSGRFTGFVLIQSQRSAFSGRFLSDGTAQVSIRRRGAPPLEAGLCVDFVNGSITGTVTDGAWVATAQGDRNVFNARNNPAPQAGFHAFLLNDESEGQMTAAASGLGRIWTTGLTIVKGRLSDGRRFVRSSFLASTGDYPLFLSFNQGTEVVIGWLNFPSDQKEGASGEVLWVGTEPYTFATSLQVTGN